MATKICLVADLQDDAYEAIQSDDISDTLDALAAEGIVPRSASKKGFDYLIFKGDFPYGIKEMWGVHGVPYTSKEAHKII